MILDTSRLASIDYVMCEYKQTWAEKRREELIYKLKKKKANWNRLIVTLLMMIGALMVLCGAVWLSTVVQNPIMPIASAYLGVQLIRLQYLFLTYVFECNPSYITVKHKGKKCY